MTDSKEKSIEENTHESYQKETLPEDKYGLVYMIMALFGVGALLPWNSILTALDFFLQRLPGHRPDFVFGFAVNGMQVFTSLANMIYGHHLPYKLRMGGGFFVISILMIVLPLVTNSLESDPAWAADLIILVIFGFFGGIVQSSSYGIAGMLPPKYMGAVMFGNGFSGIILNVVRAITIVAFPSTDANSNFLGAMVYFVLAAVILLACVACSFFVFNIPFVAFYLKKANEAEKKTVRRISHAGEIVEEDDQSQSLIGQNINKTDQSSQIVSTPHKSAPASEKKVSALAAFLIMMKHSFIIAWKWLTTICFIFFVTLAIYPGVTCDTNLKFLSGTNPTTKLAWQTLLLVFIFNVFDTIGRWLGGQPYAQLGPKLTIILAYSRVIFVVTSFLIAYNVPPSGLFGDDADWFKILNMCLFGFSNGFLGTLLAVMAPSRAPDDSKEQVGIFVGVFLTLGIVLGTIVSLIIGDFLPENKSAF